MWRQIQDKRPAALVPGAAGGACWPAGLCRENCVVSGLGSCCNQMPSQHPWVVMKLMSILGVGEGVIHLVGEL